MGSDVLPVAAGPAWNPKPCVTLKDVMDRVDKAPELIRARRTEMLSALRTVERCAGKDANDILAKPSAMRTTLRDALYLQAGINKRRWAAVRCLTLKALVVAGFRVLPGRRARKALSPAWGALRKLAPGMQSGIGLSRFMSFCTAEEIEPGDVDAETFLRYEEALCENSLVGSPHWVYRTSCILWNKARESVAGWPAIEVPLPDRRQTYSLAWDAFPEKFRKDAEAFLHHTGNQSPLAKDYVKSVKPATIVGRRKQIRQMASALVLSGFPITELTSLAVLVKAENAEKVLQFFLDRTDQAKSEATYGHASLLRAIARHWAKPKPEETGKKMEVSGAAENPKKNISKQREDEARKKRDELILREHNANVDQLQVFCESLAVKKSGMTPKNVGRLFQFENQDNVDALLGLPPLLVREAQRDDDGGHDQLSKLMYALGIEILIVAPIRIRNLGLLNMVEDIQYSGRGPNMITRIAIPGEKVKNGVSIMIDLPKCTADMLAWYIREIRPRICAVPSPWLFPNAQGHQRNVVSFGRQISKTIKRNTGLLVHPHLFRHLAVKFLLMDRPEDIESARLLLGHKTTRTTLAAYAQVTNALAQKRFEGLVDQKRADALQRPSRIRTAGTRVKA
ncbi:MAG: site-specific integrase [Rhizomicrobium sp.]